MNTPAILALDSPPIKEFEWSGCARRGSAGVGLFVVDRPGFEKKTLGIVKIDLSNVPRPSRPAEF